MRISPIQTINFKTKTKTKTDFKAKFGEIKDYVTTKDFAAELMSVGILADFLLEPGIGSKKSSIPEILMLLGFLMYSSKTFNKKEKVKEV